MSSVLCKPIKTAGDVDALLSGIKYIIFDIDGVIWSGSTVFTNIRETLRWLMDERDIKLRFVTNNATKTRQNTAKTFADRGFSGVTKEMIYGSAYGAALRLRSLAQKENLKKFNKNVFVIGERGLHEELRKEAIDTDCATTFGYELLPHVKDSFLRQYDAYGVYEAAAKRLVPGTDKNVLDLGPLEDIITKLQTPGALPRLSVEEMDIGAIVVGLDNSFNNYKLAIAGLAEQIAFRKTGKRIPFIATNEDPQLPGEGGFLLPGAGTMVAALSTLLNRKPDYVCGKPHKLLMDEIMHKENITDPSTVLMVGDRVSTDIAFGRASNCRTLMVLSGCEGMEHVSKATEDQKPHFYAKDLAELYRLAKEGKKSA